MKLKKLRDLEIELIVWDDIIETTEDAWHTEREVIDWCDDEDGVCETVGYVVGEDEAHVLVCSQIIESSSLYGTITKIPKGVIIKRIKWGQQIEKE